MNDTLLNGVLRDQGVFAAMDYLMAHGMTFREASDRVQRVLARLDQQDRFAGRDGRAHESCDGFVRAGPDEPPDEPQDDLDE
jgi:hypothetical protein